MYVRAAIPGLRVQHSYVYLPGTSVSSVKLQHPYPELLQIIQDFYSYLCPETTKTLVYEVECVLLPCVFQCSIQVTQPEPEWGGKKGRTRER